MRLDNISNESFFTPEDLAEKLRLSVATVYKLLSQEKLPYFKVGKSYRIPAGAFAAYMMQEGNLARFISTGPVIPAAARHFIDEIASAPQELQRQIAGVILFGSYARGDFDEHSDIDLLVLLKDNAPGLQQRIAEMSSAAMEATGFEEFLSPIRMSLAHWNESAKDKAPICEEVRKEGVVLWPKGSRSLKGIEAAPERS